MITTTNIDNTTITTTTTPTTTTDRFGYQLLRYIQSLPEVLHHLPAIVTLLHEELLKPWGPQHQHVLTLIAVLAKVHTVQ